MRHMMPALHGKSKAKERKIKKVRGIHSESLYHFCRMPKKKACMKTAKRTRSAEKKPADVGKKRSRPDVAMRKARNKETDFSGVRMKLRTSCKDDILYNEIQSIVWNTNKIALEAYHVANLHIIRCLTEDIPLPTIDQNFFYRCCSAVVERPTVYISEANTADEELNHTVNLFKAQRPEVEFRASPQGVLSTPYQPPRSGLTFMTCNLARDMVTNSKNHLILNFGKRLTRYLRLRYNLNKCEAWRFVDKAFSEDEDKTEDHIALAEWLGMRPYENVIKNNFHHFLRKSYEILVFIKAQPINTKGAKAFTMMPLKNSYVMSDVTICGSCLQQILQSIAKRCKVKFLDFGKIGKDTFDNHKEAFWRSLFDVDTYETANRKFAYEISTNGYTASLKIQKPKNNAGNINSFPNEADFERVAAGDPGVDFLCTVKVKDSPEGDYVRISTAEYRHMAQMRKNGSWMQNLRARNLEYADIIKQMPTCAVTSTNSYVESLSYILQHCDGLLAFCCAKGFRKWRFKQYVYSDKALHTLCKRVTNGMKTLFGLGDWSQQDGGIIKRHPTAPVKRFRKAMGVHAYVQMLDEYGTSKGCSCCGSVCKKQKLKRRKENGFEFVACHQVVRCSSNECAMCWQRDENSSNNHLKLLLCLVRGEDRPEYMRRGRN
jgi:hypothetical protein